VKVYSDYERGMQYMEDELEDKFLANLYNEYRAPKRNCYNMSIGKVPEYDCKDK
jgi:hypothetical protein